MNDKDLYWLAGFLEGEGSFIKGVPSCPNLPIISAVTTDEDVILKVSNMFGVKYHKSGGKRKKSHWKTAYAIQLRGKKAVDLMNSLKPIMGIRRQQQIENALSCYKAKFYKLTEDIVRNIKMHLRNGFTQKSIGEKFKIRRETINKISREKIWEHVKV